MISFLFMLTSISHADELKLDYYWETRPTIALCPDATIDKEEVEAALRFWKSEGIDTRVKEIKRVNHCSRQAENVIQIMGDRGNLKPGEAAVTFVHWYYRGIENKNTTYYIDVAEVQLPIGVSNTTVYHEIGHALGLGHSNHEVMRTYY